MGILTFSFDSPKLTSITKIRNAYHMLCRYKKQAHREFLNFITDRREHKIHRLSIRELDCLLEFVKGRTCRQTAEVLHLAVRTVEYYRQSIREKFASSDYLMEASELFL